MTTSSPLVDPLGRVHTDLRISVTDRCNIRCFYCMPAEGVRFKPRSELLTFEEIQRFVRVVAAQGVDKLRLTGGEPLVRQDLPELIRLLAGIPGINDVALTTNGMLLDSLAGELKAAGLNRLNISLDTLDEDRFFEITRREGLDQTLRGIEAARDAGFERIKINAVAIRDLTEPDIVPLARFARRFGLELRFIEFMPLDADDGWTSESVLSGEEIRATIEDQVAPLEPIQGADPSQPAVDYRYRDSGATIGFIDPVSQPFCHTCNRLRITAEGQIRNCLFSTSEWDARALLRGGASDAAIEELVREALAHKKPAHGIDSVDFEKPARAMYQIGG